LRRAARQGEAWTEAPDARGAPSSQTDERSFAAAALPLVATVLALNALPRACHALAALRAPEPDGSRAAQWLQQALAGFPADPALSIFLGVVVALGVLRPGPRQAWGMLGEGFTLGLLAIGATSAVVGFGAAIKDLAAFQQVVDWVTRIGGDPLIGAAIAVAVISALAGSASGGQGIALPILKPIFIDELGVAPRALHRVVAIASGSLDSLPANGYVVTLIRNICGETHQRAYGPIFVLTVVIPCFGAALAIALFKLVPSWANS
jgi:H+/gluconate symporter-like permease